MIKYLKFLWKKYFGGMGDYRIKNTPVAMPVVILKPEHCDKHSRFKKSCFNCQEIIK
jgi:hypothetical protein